MRTRTLVLILTLAISISPTFGQEKQNKKSKLRPWGNLDGAQVEVFKTIDDVELKLYIFKPDGHQAIDKRPAIVFFFGGGWRGGTPKQFARQCRYLASRGMVAMTAEYRVYNRHKVLVKECVADAKSAVRWVRANSTTLGIDPEKIASAGGSAGGHLAAAVAILDGFDEETENAKISSRSNAMLLFNPAVDLTAAGFGVGPDRPRIKSLHERLGAGPKDLSPTFHVRSGLPPTIIFHGTADKTVPFAQAERFAELMTKAGNRCELDSYDDQGHGFFNFGRNAGQYYTATLRSADAFLESLGYLDGPPTIDADEPGKPKEQDQPD